jgi:hypothetical protein
MTHKIPSAIVHRVKYVIGWQLKMRNIARKKKAVDDDSSPRYCRRQYLKWAYGTIKWNYILKLLKWNSKMV